MSAQVRSKQEPGTKSIGIWIRVSTEDQSRGESPEHHEKHARYYTEAKGWEVRPRGLPARRDEREGRPPACRSGADRDRFVGARTDHRQGEFDTEGFAIPFMGHRLQPTHSRDPVSQFIDIGSFEAVAGLPDEIQCD